LADASGKDAQLGDFIRWNIFFFLAASKDREVETELP
jgi:hypothetical protein